MREVTKALLLLSLNGFLDGADASFFKGIFRSLEVEFGFDLRLFAVMQMSISAAAMLFNPVWAIVLDQGILSQKSAMVLTAGGWGLTSVAIAVCASNATWVLGLRFVNTIFLCSGLPVGQSVVSSYVEEQHRGAAFSVVGMSGSLGVIFSTKVSTTISERRILGFAGWRFGLLAIGAASLLFAAAAATCDLRQEGESAKVESKKGSGRRRSAASVARAISMDLRSFGRIHCFWLIAAYCCFFQVWVNALLFCAMWLQFSGVPNSEVGSVVAMHSVGSMIGHVVFGFICDAAHRASPLHGRICVGQLCCGLIVPIGLALFHWLPGSSAGSLAVQSALFFSFGFLEGGWGVGVNRVILTLVVPKTQASSVMAWKNVVEQTFAMTFCPPFVAWISSANGYHSSQQRIADMPPEQVAQNAASLSQTLTLCVVLAHVGMFMMYGVMHCKFKLDLDNLAASHISKRGAQEQSEPACSGPSSQQMADVKYTQIGVSSDAI